MSKFNFDPEHFRRVISKCEGVGKVSPLSVLIKEAIDAFYDEFDYYPNTGVYAPGVFTIMGDHLEYLEGTLVQAALPFVTVIVGKRLNTIKCKVVTTATDVDGLKRMIFPINYFHNNDVKIFPSWLTYLKGVLTQFPCKEIKGFDILIHSNIPIHPGCGRSAALQVAFYTFLETVCDLKCLKNKEKKGKLCREAELLSQDYCGKIGPWCNVTSSVAESSKGVILDCEYDEVSTFYMKDINILFLLTFPKFEIEVNDRDLIPRRELELYLAATLLDLEHVKYATDEHLKILENMEDPSRETIESILQCCNLSKEFIDNFIDDLFYLPKDEITLKEEQSYFGENDYFDKTEKEESRQETEEQSEEFVSSEEESEMNTEIQKPCDTCIKPTGFIPGIQQEPREHPMEYIHQKIEELCHLKMGDQVKNIKEEQSKTHTAWESLSETSNRTVASKLFRRVRHVVSEKLRCENICDLVQKGDYVELGTKLINSHFSLKSDYEVSCPTLDNLVQLAIETEGVYGSKMISGGGTLTLLHRSVVEEFLKKILEKFGPCFKFYLVFPSPGADKVNMAEKRNPKSVLSAPYFNKTDLMKRAVQNFEITFKRKPTHGAFAPVVFNLIGDHLDYNHGFTISMATSILTVVVGSFNCTSKIRVATTLNVGQEPSKVTFPIPEFHSLGPGNVNWVKLIKGVVVHFKGVDKGFDCLIDSNTPSNVKLTKNSALAVCFYTFLEELFGKKTKDPNKKASKCMFAEHEFLSLLHGSGNHTVAVKAKEDFVTLLDCKSMKITHIPFQGLNTCFVVTYTGDPSPSTRELLYVRGEECYKVAKHLGAKTLRCLTLKDIEAIPPGKISEKAIRRATHVVLENERVLRCAEALKNSDFFEVGDLMVASHNSLRYNYEATSDDLNLLVRLALEVDGVVGCKMSCDVDAACVITLVNRWAVDDLIEYLQDNFNGKLDSFIVSTHASCGSLNIKKYLKTLAEPEEIFERVSVP